MKKILWLSALALTGALLLGPAAPAWAGSGFEIVEGEAFDTGIVKDFYLEGNAIPTQKRNAVMIKSAEGKRIVFSLLDTSGYGADVQAKYIGMAIVEMPISVGGVTLGVGAYGFGLEKAEGGAPGHFHVYDVAGEKVGSGEAPQDSELAQPVPLQVMTAPKAKLYLGRYALAIE
jgi:hypothetical protein